MMGKKSAWDFIYGGCESVTESERFAAGWIKTNGNPCSVCGNDKSKCGYYKDLVDHLVIIEE